MKTNEAKMLSVLFEAGIPFPAGGPSGMDKLINELLTLRRLALKHHRLAEMDCNGEGYIRGKFYSWDDRLSYNCSPCVSDDVSVFDVESDKVEAKIKAIADRLGLRVEFQGDPRGYTVKMFKGDRFLDIQG